VEGLAGLALPVLFIAVLYMLLIRPQQKRAKEHRRLVSSLSVGSDVVTIGGLHGRVVDLTDETMDLAVTADDDIILRFQRSSLARVLEDEDELVDDLAEDAVDDDGDDASEDR
jgi:preprotein translocase subunit YajC